MSAIEPLYVACGFALYLNRRTQLEAWDIDLAFRRLRSAAAGAGQGAAGAAGPRHRHAGRRRAPPTADVRRRRTDPHGDFARAGVRPAAGRGDDRRFARAAAGAYRDPRISAASASVASGCCSDPFKPADSGSQGCRFEGFGQLVAPVLKMLLWLLLVAARGRLLRVRLALARTPACVERAEPGRRSRWQTHRGRRHQRAAAAGRPGRGHPRAVAGATAARGAGPALSRLRGADRAAAAAAAVGRGHRGGLAAPGGGDRRSRPRGSGSWRSCAPGSSPRMPGAIRRTLRWNACSTAGRPKPGTSA